RFRCWAPPLGFAIRATPIRASSHAPCRADHPHGARCRKKKSLHSNHLFTAGQPGIAMLNALHQPSCESITDEEDALLALEGHVCSHGDTVHYAERPKIFERCKGSYLYDLHGCEYVDRQMRY